MVQFEKLVYQTPEMNGWSRLGAERRDESGAASRGYLHGGVHERAQ